MMESTVPCLEYTISYSIAFSSIGAFNAIMKYCQNVIIKEEKIAPRLFLVLVQKNVIPSQWRSLMCKSKETRQEDDGLYGLQDAHQKVEHDYVEQNEDGSEDQVTPKEVKLAEERNTCLPTADLEENPVVKVRTSQQGYTNNALCVSRDVHKNTHDEAEGSEYVWKK